MDQIKNSKNFPLWKLFPLVAFVFSPKIDIISLPNFWQGIRLDDLIILFYSILFFYSCKFKIFPNLINSKMFGYNWIIFFPYLIFAMIIGEIFDVNPNSKTTYLFVVRYMEYIALIVILNQLNPPKDKILLLFKIFILLNFFIVFLQYFDVVGGFTSRGIIEKYNYSDITNICFFNCDLGFMKNYVPPGKFLDLSETILNNRVIGITGGPWELSTNLSISFFGLALFEKRLIKLIPYFLMIILMMVLAQSRGIVFGFIAGSVFMFSDLKKTVKILSFLLFFVTFLYLFNILNFKEIMHDKFFFNYFTLIKIISGIFTGNLPPSIAFEGTALDSMYWRVYHWNAALSEYKKSNFLIIFGSGVSYLYTESLLIRIITSFGILGSLLIIYFARRLPIFFIIFIVVTGLTIDLFISFKILTFSCLLLMAINNSKKEIN